MSHTVSNDGRCFSPLPSHWPNPTRSSIKRGPGHGGRAKPRAEWQQRVGVIRSASRRVCCKYCASETEASWPRPEERAAGPGWEKHNAEEGAAAMPARLRAPARAMWNDRPCHRKARGLFPFMACQSSPTSGLSVWNRLRDDIFELPKGWRRSSLVFFSVLFFFFLPRTKGVFLSAHSQSGRREQLFKRCFFD